MERLRRFAWVAAATVFGAGLAYVATRPGPRFAFLADARAVPVDTPALEANGFVAHRRAYWVPANADRVQAGVRREFAVTLGSTPGVFVVPRVEGGRVRATFPPERTIMVAPSKQGSGTVVEMIEYSRPDPLSGLLGKVRRSLGI